MACGDWLGHADWALTGPLTWLSELIILKDSTSPELFKNIKFVKFGQTSKKL